MLFPGSVRQVADARPIDIVLLDSLGNPVFGFDESRPATSVLTQVAYVAGSVALLAANAARRQFMVHNPTNKTVYLAFAATASAAAYSVPIPQQTGYISDLNGYTGAVSVIWQAAPAAGPTLQVTEITT